MSRENDIGFAVRRLNNAIKRDVERKRTELEIEHIKGIPLLTVFPVLLYRK